MLMKNTKERKEKKWLANNRNNFAINLLHLKQETSQTSFSNLIERTTKRVKSPRKKEEVIKSLVSKFNVKVKLGQKVCRKKNVLNEQGNQWVIEFLNGRDISYTPGRRVYLGKFNKVKRITQKCCLLWTIRDKHIKDYGIFFYQGYHRFFRQA